MSELALSGPRFSTVIPASGPDGNIFAILGTATRLLRQIGRPQADIDQLRGDVLASKSYEQALGFVREWFPVDVGEA